MKIQIICISLLLIAARVLYASEQPIDINTLVGQPENVLVNIAQNLSDTDLARFSEVNRQFNAIAETIFRKRSSYWWATGDIKRTAFPAHNEPVFFVSFRNDGNVVSCGYQIKTWGVNTHQLLTQIDDSALSSTYLPSRNLLATYAHKNINVWNVETGKQINQFAVPRSPASMAFSPDGNSLAMGNYSGTVTIWNIANPKDSISTNVYGRGEVHSLCFSPDGKSLFSAAATKWSVREWSTETLEQIKKFDFKDLFPHLFFSGKILMAYTITTNRQIKLWEVQSNEEMASISSDLVITSYNQIAFSHDGTLLAIPSKNKTISIWHLQNRKIIQQLQDVDTALSLAFSLDDKTLVAGCLDGKVIIWKARIV